jgi:hypothetical protein
MPGPFSVADRATAEAPSASPPAELFLSAHKARDPAAAAAQAISFRDAAVLRPWRREIGATAPLNVDIDSIECIIVHLAKLSLTNLKTNTGSGNRRRPIKNC